MTDEKSQSPCMTCNISSACEDGACSKLYLWRKEQLKPPRRIDLMTEEELAKIIAAVDGSVFGNMCVGCVLDDEDCECSDGNECGQAIAHYLLSPAEEEKK